MDLCWQSNVSAFNMLSRLVVTFLPRSKRLLISWLQSPFAVILEPRKIKSATVSTVSPSICHDVMGPDAMIFLFWMLSFKPTFSLSSFTFIKRLFSSSSVSAIRVALEGYNAIFDLGTLIHISLFPLKSPKKYMCRKIHGQEKESNIFLPPPPFRNYTQDSG